MSAPILLLRLICQQVDNPESFGITCVEWMLFRDGRPQEPVGRAELSELSSMMVARGLQAQARIVLIVPAHEVVMTRVVIPPNQKRQAHRIVPYILEDYLNQNVQDVFFACEWLPSSQDVGVAYVDKIKFKGWLDLLAAQGIRPDVVYPEQSLLPNVPGQCCVIFEADRVFFRRDHWVAACAPLQLAETWLETVLEERVREHRAGAQTEAGVEPDKIGIRFLLETRDQRAAELSAACLKRFASQETLGVNLEMRRLVLQQSVTHVLALEAVRLISGHEPFQMLQGEFKGAKAKRQSRYPWKTAAVIMLMVLFVELAYTATNTYIYKTAALEVREQNIKMFKSAFPGVTRIRGSLRRALDSALADQGRPSDVDFLALLTTTAPGMKKANGLVIEQIDYKRKQGVLGIDFYVADFADLERIKMALEASKLNVEIDGGTKIETGVKARLKVYVS